MMTYMLKGLEHDVPGIPFELEFKACRPCYLLELLKELIRCDLLRLEYLRQSACENEDGHQGDRTCEDRPHADTPRQSLPSPLCLVAPCSNGSRQAVRKICRERIREIMSGDLIHAFP
jgi:hypothetical protein